MAVDGVESLGLVCFLCSSVCSILASSQDGLLSTPAASAVIRTREGGFVPFGAFILSASHNPGISAALSGPPPPKSTASTGPPVRAIELVCWPVVNLWAEYAIVHLYSS